LFDSPGDKTQDLAHNKNKIVAKVANLFLMRHHMDIDPRTFRNIIGLFATGVTVVSVEADGMIHGMTANSVTSVSLEPLLLLVCVDRKASMAGALGEAGRFAVSILRDDQEAISRHFARQSGPPVEPAFTSLGSTQRLTDCMAALSCVTERILDGGDHLIFLARVEALWAADEPGNPLLYFGGKYRTIGA
jgi:flavin reductase (DIM6/NTAB) family NADH-FMN oxidoreductase RutF